MANLRDLIDGKAVDVQAKSDVFNHLKDVKDKQNAVDVATLKLHNKLAPARQMIQMVDQQHPMPGQDNQQQQFDEQGNPLPMQQNQQQQPGMQTNPASATQQTNQNMKRNGQQPVASQKKPAFGNANKTSTKDKIDNDQNNKAKKKQIGGKKGFEIHVKAEEDDGDDGDMDSKKSKKKLHGRFDYHDNPGKDSGAGRAIGLSGGGPGSGRHGTGGNPSNKPSGRTNAVARSFGYSPSHTPSSTRTHSNGHSVTIDKDGSWLHKTKEGKSTQGNTFVDLRNHLRTIHKNVA